MEEEKKEEELGEREGRGGEPVRFKVDEGGGGYQRVEDVYCLGTLDWGVEVVQGVGVEAISASLLPSHGEIET